MHKGTVQLKIKIVYYLQYIGFILLLTGLAFLFITFISSSSANHVVLGRYSLPLGFVILLLGALLLCGCLFAIFKPGRVISTVRRVFAIIGRVPGLLELTVAFGWIPLVFIYAAGRNLTPLAGELNFINGLWLLYAGWVFLSVAAPSGKRRKALLERLLLLGISSILCLVLLEVALRVISPGSVFTTEIELIPNLNLRIDVDLPGMSTIANHTTNKWGLRGEEPPNDWDEWFTIVTIGGSTTHCYYIDDRRTWSYLLQENLRNVNQQSWVGNGGLSGHTTRAHIIFMQEIVPVISPDLVVLLIGINDTHFSTRQGVATSGIEDETTTLRYKIFAASRLYQILYRWIQISFGDVHMLTENLTSYEPEPLDGPDIELPDDIREFCISMDEYNSNIRTIIRLARESDVQVVFMTQPMLWEDTEYWRGIQQSYYWTTSDKTRLSAASLSRILDAFNQELLVVCREEGVPCLDLALLVPHTLECFYDGVHFTEAGSVTVAELLAEFLLDEGLIEMLP